MEWEIKYAACGMEIQLLLEEGTELADFIARMGIVANGNQEVENLLKAAQEFPELGDPNDEIFEEFFGDLCEATERMLEDE